MEEADFHNEELRLNFSCECIFGVGFDILLLLAGFKSKPYYTSSSTRPWLVWAWSSILWNHIGWLGVPFEIQPNEAIYKNLRQNFWLNFKRNLSVRISASTYTNCDMVTSGAQESTVLSAFICSDYCCFYLFCFACYNSTYSRQTETCSWT